MASISVGPEIFLYDEDPLRWRSELIRRWNRLPGVTQHNGGDLSATNVRLLMDRVRESNWLWQAAMAKFPLWFSSGWRPTLGWFLKPDNVANILDGNYERPVKQEGSKPEPRILEPITYTEAELEGAGDDV